MHHTTNHTTERTSVLANLRALLPNRTLRLHEALRLAELQAHRLHALRGGLDVPVSSEIVTGLPGITIDYDHDMPTAASGSSDWDSRHRHWVIYLRTGEPITRHRFTLLHEYKHIIDHGHPGITEPNAYELSTPPAAETVANHFAACVLMPKRLIKAAYFSGTQSIGALAELFEVSPAAIRVRLAHLGLSRSVDVDPLPALRCQPLSVIARHEYSGTPASIRSSLSAGFER